MSDITKEEAIQNWTDPYRTCKSGEHERVPENAKVVYRKDRGRYSVRCRPCEQAYHQEWMEDLLTRGRALKRLGQGSEYDERGNLALSLARFLLRDSVEFEDDDEEQRATEKVAVTILNGLADKIDEMYG